jgi:hypothetical protein
MIVTPRGKSDSKRALVTDADEELLKVTVNVALSPHILSDSEAFVSIKILTSDCA